MSKTPLAMLDGRPVHEGNIILHNGIKKVVVRSFKQGGETFLEFHGGAGSAYADNRMNTMAWPAK